MHLGPTRGHDDVVGTRLVLLARGNEDGLLAIGGWVDAVLPQRA